jgi:glycine/D-amino acid oxidase-like deaminating enzyme
VWAADIAGTGWYGFPLSPSGVVKVAHHGPGRMMRATDPREVAPDEEARFRAFLRERLPALADAPVAATRLCLYTDTLDGDFLIDADPDRPGLVVATGGSGHALKFAPLLGDIIADATLDAPSPWRARFSWRRSAEAVAQRSADAARFTGS